MLNFCPLPNQSSSGLRLEVSLTIPWSFGKLQIFSSLSLLIGYLFWSYMQSGVLDESPERQSQRTHRAKADCRIPTSIPPNRIPTHRFTCNADKQPWPPDTLGALHIECRKETRLVQLRTPENAQKLVGKAITGRDTDGEDQKLDIEPYYTGGPPNS